MMTKNQKGFSAVEGFLILVIAGLIGFIGWYVWNAKNKTDKSLDKSSATLQAVAIKKTPPPTETKPQSDYDTSNWKEYSSPDGWKMKIPDGWKLADNGTSLTSEGDLDTNIKGANLDYKAGTPAQIDKIEGGRDGLFRFNASYFAGFNDMSIGSKVGSFAATNVTGTKYLRTVIPTDGPDDPVGSQQYKYIFKNGTGQVYIIYVVVPGDTDHLNLVEAAIKTLQI